jgi:hypothetical protein
MVQNDVNRGTIWRSREESAGQAHAAGNVEPIGWYPPGSLHSQVAGVNSVLELDARMQDAEPSSGGSSPDPGIRLVRQVG